MIQPDPAAVRDAATPVPTGPTELSGFAAFPGLEDVAGTLAELDAAVERACETQENTVLLQARKLRRTLRAFEPSVTFIGQVKAGKTTLVNAMAGWPDLLPSDVNPWTSVVTALHLEAAQATPRRRAAFRFFDTESWDNLVRSGGRVGEIANRAGAAEDREKVRAQLEKMREKSKARLGARFELLLGQVHDYDAFDPDLIQRYVALGDAFWNDPDSATSQARYADITQAADLWFDTLQVPMRLCLRDTPGANDTFLIREQITLDAMAQSRCCVVVLSAAQALSSVDLGLIRLMSAMESRDVVVFVNRIDELADPARQVPEIERSIRDTLKAHQCAEDVQVLFGSGHWAHQALAGRIADLGGHSADALVGWAEAQLEPAMMQRPPVEIIWHLSGIPALGQAVAGRIAAGPVAELAAATRAALTNLAPLRQGAVPGATSVGTSAATCRLSRDAVAQKVHALKARTSESLEKTAAGLRKSMNDRCESARAAFLDRATQALVTHLEAYGEGEVWTYNPAGLRVLLRSGYSVFVRAVDKAGTQHLETAATEMAALYQEVFDLPGAGPSFEVPPLPKAPTPVRLGQTIALDLQGSWWTRFWRRRRGYDAMARDFATLIHEETLPVADALQETCVEPCLAQMSDTVFAFLDSQTEILMALACPAPPDDTVEETDA